jgi:hypothetical protein
MRIRIRILVTFYLNVDPDLGSQTIACPDPGHFCVGLKVNFYMKSTGILYVGT